MKDHDAAINIQIPEPFSVTTGAEEEDFIRERIDSFFTHITEYLGYNNKAREAFAQVTEQSLGLEQPHGFMPSDNKITYLIARDLLVASVLQRRNDRNFIEVVFAQYLTAKRVSFLRKGVVSISFDRR